MFVGVLALLFVVQIVILLYEEVNEQVNKNGKFKFILVTPLTNVRYIF